MTDHGHHVSLHAVAGQGTDEVFFSSFVHFTRVSICLVCPLLVCQLLPPPPSDHHVPCVALRQCYVALHDLTARSLNAEEEIQSYIATWHRLRKREPLITPWAPLITPWAPTRGAFDFCINGTPPRDGDSFEYHCLAEVVPNCLITSYNKRSQSSGKF